MKRWLILLVWVGFCAFSCSSKNGQEEKLTNYLTLILGESPNVSRRYIMVSDFGCSPCKEKIYQKIERKTAQSVYIVLLPRNKAVLQDRFHDAILEKRVFIDSVRINLENDVIIDKAAEIVNLEGKWILRDLEL